MNIAVILSGRIGSRLGEQIALKSERAFSQLVFEGQKTLERVKWYPRKELRDQRAREEEEFYLQFLHSSLAGDFAAGDSSVLAGMSGVEMAYRVILENEAGAVLAKPVFQILCILWRRLTKCGRLLIRNRR